MKKKLENNKKFYFGDMIIFVPILFLIISILFLVIEKKASLKTFWISGFFSIILTYIFIKDKKSFGQQCVKNLNNNSLLSCNIFISWNII